MSDLIPKKLSTINSIKDVTNLLKKPNDIITFDKLLPTEINANSSLEVFKAMSKDSFINLNGMMGLPFASYTDSWFESINLFDMVSIIISTDLKSLHYLLKIKDKIDNPKLPIINKKVPSILRVVDKPRRKIDKLIIYDSLLPYVVIPLNKEKLEKYNYDFEKEYDNRKNSTYYIDIKSRKLYCEINLDLKYTDVDPVDVSLKKELFYRLIYSQIRILISQTDNMLTELESNLNNIISKVEEQISLVKNDKRILSLANIYKNMNIDTPLDLEFKKRKTQLDPDGVEKNRITEIQNNMRNIREIQNKLISIKESNLNIESKKNDFYISQTEKVLELYLKYSIEMINRYNENDTFRKRDEL
jgi:hypothetical protein